MYARLSVAHDYSRKTLLLIGAFIVIAGSAFAIRGVTKRYPIWVADNYGYLVEFNSSNNTIAERIAGFGGPVGALFSNASYVQGSSQGTVYLLDQLDNEVDVFDIQTSQVIDRIMVTEPAGATYGGNYLYVTSAGGGLSKISLATNSLVATLNGFSNPGPIAVSHDGNWLYVANNPGLASNISIVSTSTFTIATNIANGFGQIHDLEFNSAGTLLYVVCLAEVGVFAYPSNQFQTFFGSLMGGGSLAIAATSGYAYVTNAQEVDVFNLSNNTLVTRIPGFLSLQSITYSTDTGQIYVSGYNPSSGGGNVCVINPLSNTITTCVNGFGKPQGMAIEPPLVG